MINCNDFTKKNKNKKQKIA